MQRTWNPVLNESTKNLYELILFVKAWLFMMYCCSAFRERASCEMGFSWRDVQQFTVREIGQPESRRYWFIKLFTSSSTLLCCEKLSLLHFSVNGLFCFVFCFFLAAATENLLDINDYSSAVENVDSSTEPNNNTTTLWVRSRPLMNMVFLSNESHREDSTWVTADNYLYLSP